MRVSTMPPQETEPIAVVGQTPPWSADEFR